MTWEMQVSSGAWVDAPFKPPVRIEAGKKATFTFQGIPCSIEFKSATEAKVTAKDKTYIARPKKEQGSSGEPDLRAVVDDEEAVYALLWTKKGDKVTVTAHYMTPERIGFLNAQRGDDKSFVSESYGVEVGANSKSESAIGRVWASGRAEIVDRPGDDMQFARRNLAKEFNITKICCRALEGGVLEWGFGPTCRTAVEDMGAAYALLWSVKFDKITPTDHYVTPERRAYLKTLRGDDKNFGSESYGIELAKDESAIGRVWASGRAETVDNPGDDMQFARQRLANDFNITKIYLKPFAGGVLEWGFGPTCKSVVEDAGAAYALVWSLKGDKITPTEHYVTPERRAYLKTLRGDDKNFGSESYGIELAKNESAIGRVWAGGSAETINRPADDKQFTRQQLAKDFNITKICLKAFAGGVLEWGFGATCRNVVEDEGASYALLWSVRGDKITPTEHYVTPERAAYLKTKRGDDKNFACESYGTQLAKNESAVGRVWASGSAEAIDKPGDEQQFARQQLAKDFNITKIYFKAFAGGVLEWGFGAPCRSVVEDEGADYALFWSVKGDKITPTEHYVTPERASYLKTLRGDGKNFASESYGTELAKNESAIGRVWASGMTEIINTPTDNFARLQLAKEFNINKICLKAFAGGVLEWGFGPTCRSVVENEGAAYALLWSVKGNKITPTEHYVIPERAAYLKTQRGDDKNFGSESYGIELAKDESAIGRVWASGRAEIIDKPANDNQFTRQQLAKDFNVTKICLKAFAGGVLEWGFGPTCKSLVEDEGAAYALLWSVKGDKITPVQSYITPQRTTYLKTLRGDDKNFASESFGIELAKNESAIGRVWASGGAETVDKPGDDNQFARQQLAKNFNITKICLEARPGGVLEWGFGPACRDVVENTGASYALLWSVKGSKITPTEHYVTPERASFLKTMRGDDKNFGTESYGIELAKNESAIGRVWASGGAETVVKPGDDNQFARQQLAKDFNINKICLKAFAGGVLEWGMGPTCKGVVEDAGAAYALLWSVTGDKITPTEHYVTPERRAYLKTLRGDDKNFGTESYGFELAKNESAIGRVWASGCSEIQRPTADDEQSRKRAETIDRPADDQQFARKQLAKDFNITRIYLEAQPGGVLEWGFGPTCQSIVEDAGASYALLWSAKGDKITPTDHYVTPQRTAFLQARRGDDKNFGSESHGIELAKNESAIGRVWANGGTETIDRPADDNQFARQQLAKDFGITKIYLKAFAGGVLEYGFGDMCRGVVEDEGASYALFWSVKGDTITPAEHYVTPERAAYLKTVRGDDKNFGTGSYGFSLTKNESAIGRVWASGRAEDIYKPSDDNNFARQQLAKEFNITKICLKAFAGGVLEWGFGATCKAVVEDEGAAYALLWSVEGDKITPAEHYVTPGRAAYLKTLRGDDKNFASESYGTKLAKNESAVGRVWAGGAAETVDRPGDDQKFARQRLANDFNITKICFKAFAGGVLEWGFGSTCQAVVEEEGAAYALLWSVKGDKITPTDHYVTPARAAYLKTLRGDDKNFGSESHGIELAKNESAVGRVWASGGTEIVDRPADDNQFARQQLAKNFNITKICLKTCAGGVLEWGFGATCRSVVEDEGAAYSLLWSVKGNKITPTEHYVTPTRAAYLKTLRGDDKNFGSQSYGVELAKYESAVGRVWASGRAETVDQPGDDQRFARQQLAQDFDITKICFKAFAGGVLEWGFGPTCKTVVENEGAAYGLLWSVKGDKITPTEHFVIPGRAAYLKTLRGDDKNFGSESYGIELAKNESAIGRVWASGRAETINKPADDKQFARQQLAKDFNITKIGLKAFAGGVLEWGFGPTCKSLVEDEGANYALLWSVKGDKITPTEHYVTPQRATYLKTLRGDDKNFASESYSIELGKNESAIGRVWASHGADTIDKPGDDQQFARQQLAKDFNITKICLEAQPGGVLEWGFGPACRTVVENTGASYALLWTVKGNKITPTEYFVTPARAAYLKTLRGDDKNFGSESYGIELAKNESAVGRVWESGRAETIDKPADDNQFARQQLAKDFNITKICLRAFAGGVLEWGIGPTCRTVVEDAGAAYALLWSVKGDKITPVEHYVTPERAAYLKTLRGDDKNFGTESYGIELAKNESAMGRVWASGHAETVDKPGDDNQFARQQLAKDFNITRICLEAQPGGVLEWGFGPTCKSLVEDEGAAYALLWSVKGDKITPVEHYVTPQRTAFLKTLRGDDKNFGTESYGIELAKNESAIGRVWASGRAETVDKPGDDDQFARQQLAKDFNINKIYLKAFAGGVLEWGFGPACRSVVEDEGAAYALLWSVKGTKITPTEHYVTPERTAFLKALRGDDKNFGSGSYGFELARNQSAIGRVWESGRAETVDNPGDDDQFARQQLAKDFNITKICLKSFAGGVLEWGYGCSCRITVEDEGAAYALLWTVKGDKITPVEHYVTPERAVYLKTLRGDDKNFGSESYGIALAKNESAIGRVWASGVGETVDQPGDDKQFARQQLAKNFNITKICLKAFAGGVLEWGFGATCRSVVEDEGAAYALLWSVKGDKITPTEHYVTPQRGVYLKTLRGDDKNFGTESYGIMLAKNESAVGRVWASGGIETVDKPGDDQQFARQRLANDFNITKICLKAFPRGVLEYGFGPVCRSVVEDEGAAYALLWSVKGAKITPTEHYVTPERAAYLKTVRGDHKNFGSQSYGIELAKNESAIGRVWASGRAEIVLNPGDDKQFARHQLAKDFNITKICLKAFAGGILEFGFGPTCKTVVENEGAAYGLLWSVKGDKITPTEHYVTPERRAFLKTQRGDDKNFGSESYGIELAKNESAIGRVWANGGAEVVDKPGDDQQFARQQLAKDFKITKISLKACAGGVLEWGYGPI